MLFFLISFLSFLVLLSKSLPLQPLTPWASETRSKNCMKIIARLLGFSTKMSLRKKSVAKVENVEETEAMSVLDLPELTLEIVLGKLSPGGLCNMAGVCSSLRERCRSDHLWERHMREKWAKLIGQAARREWEWSTTSRKHTFGDVMAKAKPRGWIGSLSCVWPLWLLKSRLDSESRQRSYVPDGSIMSWYLALESGEFWFPAQVYNREHGHVGFMLSCYDAVLSYDCHTDTFRARYPPHGHRSIVVEEEVQWDRLRQPPVDTSAHDLHISDCMSDLCPGDHIEIQWRRNKEFPYGWWYGVVGHLESCDGNEYCCRCHSSDTVILEFNQYTPGSRWRRVKIDRKNHREEGNETHGFYGGIRKLQSKEEIAAWRKWWPTDVLE